MKFLIAAALAVSIKAPEDNQALLYKFTTGEPAPSDETVNGDSLDNREIEKEDKPNELIVDYNGHTNRGYGSKRPMDFFDDNHILSGTFDTEPRESREGNPNWVPYSNKELGYTQPFDNEDYPNNPGTIQWNK